MKIHFRKEAGADEIIDDIERRISELFTEKLTAGSQVITIADVEEVIARMGKPEELEPDGNEAGAKRKVGREVAVPVMQVQTFLRVRRKYVIVFIVTPMIGC